jgi:hypothetical protein
VLIGGSFVTSKDEPADLDCVIVYANEKNILERRESLDISGKRVDIFFCAISQTEVAASFVKLFSQSKTGELVGCVIVHLREGSRTLWDVQSDVDEKTFEIVKRSYINRHFVERQPREKALVTIHGIRTQAEWNSEVSLIASINGWVVAPFQYGYVDVDVFMNRQNEMR